MTRETDINLPIGPEDLVAYLDGETDPQTCQEIERRLAQDPQLMQRMREHQRAWDLLDELPRGEVSDQFAQTTLQMVAVAASEDVQRDVQTVKTRRRWLLGVAVIGLIASLASGFWLASFRLSRPNRLLLQELPVIENLAAIQQAESVDFLRALEDEGLFVAEVDDE